MKYFIAAEYSKFKKAYKNVFDEVRLNLEAALKNIIISYFKS